ncbi:MAG: hypothetical protein ACFFAS_15285 [Promethearchaeota archaeon]
MIDNDIELQKINEIIHNLTDIKGFHSELISLYVPYNRSRSDIVKYLKKEQGETKNIKLKATKKNIFSSITTLIGQVNKL